MPLFLLKLHLSKLSINFLFSRFANENSFGMPKHLLFTKWIHLNVIRWILVFDICLELLRFNYSINNMLYVIDQLGWNWYRRCQWAYIGGNRSPIHVVQTTLLFQDFLKFWLFDPSVISSDTGHGHFLICFCLYNSDFFRYSESSCFR